jgi:antitoxin ParD1/3/4
MMIGMTTKIAITLPDEQVAAAKNAVAEGRAASVSAYISAALARRAADEQLLEMLVELDAQEGEPSPEDYERAERALGLR